MSSVHFGRKPNRKRVCGSLNRTSRNHYGSEPNRTRTGQNHAFKANCLPTVMCRPRSANRHTHRYNTFRFSHCKRNSLFVCAKNPATNWRCGCFEPVWRRYCHPVRVGLQRRHISIFPAGRRCLQEVIITADLSTSPWQRKLTCR